VTRADPEYGHLIPLLEEYASTDEDDPRREILRAKLVTGFLPVAQHIARRFSNRGEPLDDLVQVATVGLINAVDRFSPERGSDFFSFAVPTISGEVRRHFRDLGWSMRVPRRLKDMHVSINGVVAELSQSLGRAPKPTEIAWASPSARSSRAWRRPRPTAARHWTRCSRPSRAAPRSASWSARRTRS
jgi:RNA polymerase sigma-B factor